MRFLLEPEGATDLADLGRAGNAAHAAGLNGVLLRASPSLPAPLVAAAALASLVPDLLLAVEVPLGDRHPLEVAEEAVVVDHVSTGRLVLVVRPADDGRDFAEAVDLLRVATAAAPFRFEGRRWRVPANLPQNVHNAERRVRVTPAPPRARLELWTAGADPEVALERGLGHLSDTDVDETRLGRRYAAALERGAAALGAPRARRHDWSGPDALVATLRNGREACGQDWAAVRAPTEAADAIGRLVRPRVQLDRLPPGLEAHWAS